MNKFLIKIFKVMLILTVFTANKEDLIIIKSDIFTFIIYAEAVRDLT